MKEFEGLVSLGRLMKTTSATRGCLIQLEGDVAYMVNEPRSIMIKVKFTKNLGSGTFYAGEAVSMAETVERRDDRVLFEWREKGKDRRSFVPDKEAFKDKAEAVLSKYYVEPNVKVPIDFLDDLSSDILISRVRIVGDKIITRQKRSDGTVMLENEVKLRRGLVEAENYADTGEVSVFTQDLFVLKGNAKELWMDLAEKKPISLKGTLEFGGKFRGIVAFLVYEV